MAPYSILIVKNMDRWLYLLFEHKSVQDKKAHKKLLRYIVEIWDQLEEKLIVWKFIFLLKHNGSRIGRIREL